MNKVYGDKVVKISEKMVAVLELLKDCPNGGFATAVGYVSTSDRTVPEVADINFTSKFSYENLLKAKKAALENVNASDVDATADEVELFENCKKAMLDSIETTLSGDRSDAYRTAHDTFYVHFDRGVKGHLKTAKIGKETVLVLEDGLPVVDSIMIDCLEVGRKVISEGVYKVVKNGPKVLMDKRIKKVLRNLKVKEFKTLSLKEDGFDTLKIGGYYI
jgi:hypothetical protein